MWTESTQRFPHLPRGLCPDSSLCQLLYFCISLMTFVLLLPRWAHAQGGVPLVTVATDQSSLQLSNQFGVPAGTAINQAGDFAFVGSGDSALFMRAAGATGATRLLQIDDQVPGFPGSQVLTFSPELSLNASRVLLFGVLFTGGDGLPHSALLSYDSTNYHTLISSDGVAPGANAATYGLTLIPGSIDDSGDVNFAAIPTDSASAALFILPSGGSAVRIVGFGDTPPAACTWCVASSSGSGGFLNGVPSGSGVLGLYVPPLNAKGQMLISLWGGLFIGAKDGTFSLVPMAATGVCSPQSTAGALAPVQVSAFLNNNGVVAFTNPPNSGAICVAPAGGGTPAPAVSGGDAAPASLGGSITSPTALGLDDSGDIVFQSAVSGGTIATLALMRYHPANTPSEVIAYSCEQAPGTNGALLSPSSASVSCGPGIVFAVPSSEFRGISIANDGSVSFNAFLSSGGSAVYRQTGSAAPQFIALDPTSTSGLSVFPPGVGIGLLSVSGFTATGQTIILNNDSVFFASYLSGGAADFAVQLGTPGNVKSLMSTADALPSGARTIVGSAPPQAAGHFVAFTAQPAAGRTNVLESDLTSGTITRVVSDNDPALATAGGPAGITVVAPNFFLNDSGQIAFETVGANAPTEIGVVVLGGGTSVNTPWSELPSACGAIFLWSPSGGLKKVVAAGDAAPNSTTPFSCVTMNEASPSPLNSAGEVLFSSPNPFGQVVPCNFCGVPVTPTSAVNGDFLYDATGKITEVAAANDTLPGQSVATSFVPSLAVPLNSAGQTAFGAQLGLSTWGFYLRNGSAVQKVMANGDPVPGSSDVFGFPHFIGGLSDGGNLAFTAATSAADGLFLATAGGAIQTLALDGGTAPMPVGGTFSFVPAAPTAPPGSIALGNLFKNFATINGESDVAFGATITGGTADSGYFRQLQGGTLQPIAWQGEAAPGGGTFNTILSPSSILASLGIGSNFSLGPDGTVAFVNLFTASSLLKQGMFVARPDGTLLNVASTGDFLPGGGVLANLSMSSKLAAGDAGQFAFGASIVGGSARRAIYVTAIPPGTASTTTTLDQLASPALARQSVALTATVTSTTSGTPTGMVTFFANGISLGAGSLSTGGQAAVNTSSLNAGPISLIAQYGGDSNFAPGDSAPLSVVVAGFATPPSNLAVTAGQNLVIPLTLFAPAGSGMNFTLSCSELPANSACMFDTNPVAPGPGGTSVHLTLTTKSSSRVTPPFSRKGFRALPAFGLAGFFVLLFTVATLASRRTPQLRLVCCACLATFALAIALGGCGVTGYTLSTPPTPGTPAGPASFTVTGTSGSTVISTVVNVTVQ
jgi:hypothetical protein